MHPLPLVPTTAQYSLTESLYTESIVKGIEALC